MYLPGSAISILLEYLLTFSGKPLLVPCLVRVALRVVDFVLGSCTYRIEPCSVALRAFSLASFRSLSS